MKLRPLYIVGATAAAVLLTVTGCSSSGGTGTNTGSGTETSGSQTGPSEAPSSAGTAGNQAGKQITVGLALAGPRNDGSFYQSYYDGVEDIKDKLNLKVSVVDNLESTTDITNALKNLATSNELVIGGGSALSPVANNVAAAYPKTTFVMSGPVTAGIKNLHSYQMLQGVPAYIAGAMAAKISKSGHIGYIGGATIPSTKASDIDFEAGAKSVNPDIKYSHVTVGDFSDAAKAKQAAAAQISAGADVIYAFLDAGLPGAIEAVKDSGKDVKLMNPTTDRCKESDQLVGYDYQNLGALVQQIVSDFSDTKIPSGNKIFKIENPSVQKWTMCPNSKDLQPAADALAGKINSGAVTMPAGGLAG